MKHDELNWRFVCRSLANFLQEFHIQRYRKKWNDYGDKLNCI